jgi:NADH-dependent peroxiredoxin subunit F
MLGMITAKAGGFMYDVMIVGAGPAGMTAAVYAARKRMRTLLITEEFGGQPMWTLGVENYMGYQYITGPELMDKFKEQVQQHELDQEEGRVVKIARDGENFIVHTEAKTFHGRTIIIASGKRPRMLQVPGEDSFNGRGVSYCATCDGPLFSSMDVAIVGGGNSGVQAAIEMSAIAKQVYLIIRGNYSADAILLEKVQNTKNVTELKGYDTTEIKGDKMVEALVLKDCQTREVKEIPVQGVFVEIGLVPNTSFVEGLVDLNARKEIIVDCQCRTSVPGILAAGDVTIVPEKQIVIAAGEGAKATLEAYAYLLKK